MPVQQKQHLNLTDIFLPPNLVSLSRIILTIPIAYFLWLGTDTATLVCFILIVVAALTDFLDGFLARKLNQITPLGLVLDPLADKLLAIIVIIELIFFRDFPLWLAAAIILRDLLIVIGGLALSRTGGGTPPSTLTGKYYFSAVAVLLITYIINFEFGITLFIYITGILLVLSTIVYFRRFLYFKKTGTDTTFDDRPFYRNLRIIITLAISIIFLYRLYTDIVRNLHL